MNTANPTNSARPCKCDNCGSIADETALATIRNYSMRVDFPPGHPDLIEPAGECQDCGALAYPLQ